MEMTVRPLGPWPGARTASRREAPFKRSTYDSDGGKVYASGRERVPLGETLVFLKRELQEIGCRRAVIEAGYREDQIRADGWPKSTAAAPADPGVILRIVESRVGTLTYPCDTFKRHEDNIRAIALALQALRKVDRYGVTKSGEQYSGWKALPARGTTTLTAEAAAAIIVARSAPGLDTKEAEHVARAVLRDPAAARSAFLDARKKTHPDAGGKTEDFQLVGQAWGVLVAHHGGGNGR